MPLARGQWGMRSTVRSHRYPPGVSQRPGELQADQGDYSEDSGHEPEWAAHNPRRQQRCEPPEGTRSSPRLSERPRLRSCH